MPDGGQLRILSGWGATAPTAASVVEPDQSTLPALLSRCGPRGVLARGLGRSYGDAAQNAGGLVLAPLPPRIDLLGGGLVRVSAGTSLHDLIRELLPRGLFVPVTPGTRYVTVGGAIACDVHGKNHHRSGSFGSHVRSLDLVLADGSRCVLTPDDNDPQVRDRFWATVGGLGLTGVITSAVLSCIPVETGHMVVDTERSADLDGVMSRLREADRTHTYTVAWIDTTARGRNLGRGIVTLGEHASTDQVPRPLQGRAPVVPGAPRIGVPVRPPMSLVNRATARAFNEVWFHRAPHRRSGELQTIGSFFHPLDGVADWNLVYGPRGLVQYQLVVPESAEVTIRRVLECVSEAGAPGFLSVLKRFGPGSPSPLSFPLPGWTLALDLPASASLGPLLARLDRMVIDASGRVYLAKDSRMDGDALRRMYPRFEEFLAMRENMDPQRVFCSDLARRLGL